MNSKVIPNALNDKSAVLWTKSQHPNWNARQVPELNRVLATNEFRPWFLRGLDADGETAGYKAANIGLSSDTCGTRIRSDREGLHTAQPPDYYSYTEIQSFDRIMNHKLFTYSNIHFSTFSLRFFCQKPRPMPHSRIVILALLIGFVWYKSYTFGCTEPFSIASHISSSSLLSSDTVNSKTLNFHIFCILYLT